MAPDREPDKPEDNPADGEKLWLNGMDELGQDTRVTVLLFMEIKAPIMKCCVKNKLYNCVQHEWTWFVSNASFSHDIFKSVIWGGFIS